MKPYLSLIRFDRPIGSLLLLWPTISALVLASNGRPPILVSTVFILGVILTRSAGCIINDLADIKFDKYVERTKNRPLVLGTVSKKSALILFVTLIGIALFLAILVLKTETLLMSIPALILLISYPFMKRFFAIPQIYLGVAFSFGILMAFIEIKGQINLSGWLLFITNLFWTLGYDTIYAMVDLDDDKKTNIKTSAKTLGKNVVLFIAICYIFSTFDLIILNSLFSFKIISWLIIFIIITLFLSFIGYSFYAINNTHSINNVIISLYNR